MAGIPGQEQHAWTATFATLPESGRNGQTGSWEHGGARKRLSLWSVFAHARARETVAALAQSASGLAETMVPHDLHFLTTSLLAGRETLRAVARADGGFPDAADMFNQP